MAPLMVSAAGNAGPLRWGQSEVFMRAAYGFVRYDEGPSASPSTRVGGVSEGRARELQTERCCVCAQPSGCFGGERR
jgi:hypothetical protein